MVACNTTKVAFAQVTNEVVPSVLHLLSGVWIIKS